MDERAVVTRVGLAPIAVELLNAWSERRRARRTTQPQISAGKKKK